MQVQPTDSPIRLMVVEDDVHFQQDLLTALEGIPDIRLVGIAATRAQGLHALAGPAADVLLCDLGLPDGSGIDIIRAAQTLWPDCAAMVSTIFGDEAHVLSSIEAGASGYFVVPIDFLSLSATICSAAVQARDLSTMTERTAKLHESLTADQTVSTVVGILMERYRFQRSEAYERLRRYSRTERRKVVEVATEIVSATEELGKTMRAIESVAREP